MIVNKYLKKSEKNVRVTLTVPESIAESMEHYAYYIEDQTGVAMKRKEVGVMMLRFFFDQDKKFKKWHEKNRDFLREGITGKKQRDQLLADAGKAGPNAGSQQASTQRANQSNPEEENPMSEDSEREKRSALKHETTESRTPNSGQAAASHLPEESEDGDGGPQKPDSAPEPKAEDPGETGDSPNDKKSELKSDANGDQPKGRKIGGIKSTGPRPRVLNQQTEPFTG